MAIPWTPAHAQSRMAVIEPNPAPLQTAVDLAAILGELHAIRVACAGLQDQLWRIRMQQILAYEGGPATMRRDALINAFNRGYANGGSGGRACTPEMAQRERRLAEEGSLLAGRVAESYLRQ